ncbi:MAG: hypothetical protein AMK72_05500 [Planctomycetes bacterium SM23_25]|nr:MAG: hypothetical protein AMK72_05500 [Planctomycetes bacterium SM23_25]
MSTHNSPKVLGTLAAAMALLVWAGPAAKATEYTWTGALAGREWDAKFEVSYGNWYPSTALPGTGDTVIFSSAAPPAAGDVLLNGNRDVDTVRFANPSGTYTLKGPADTLSAATIEQTAAAAAAVNEIQAIVEGTGGGGGNELNLAVEAGSLKLSGAVGGLITPTVYNGMVAAGAHLVISNTESATPNYTTGNIQVSGTLTVHGANNSALDSTNVELQGGTLILKGATVPGAPSTGVQLYWGFNEGAGTTALDGSPNGRTGTIANALWVGSQAGYGGALDFNGTDSEVSLNGDVSFLNGLSDLTVAMWIQSDATSQDRGFVELRDNAGQDQWGMRYDSEGDGALNVIKTGMTLNTSGGNANRNDDQYVSSAGVQTTAWQHVAMTWQDGVGFKLYVDGTLDGPATRAMVTTTGVTDMVDRFTVGDGSKAYWDGRIDEVYIYNRALDSGEINTVMTSPGLFAAMGVQMAGTVTVFGDSTINVDGPSATVGGLEPTAGSTLHVTGSGPFSADATTFTGGAVALDTQVETRLGRLADDLVAPTRVTKTGAADLVLGQTDWPNDGDNTTMQIDEGRLVVAGDAVGFDPLGGAAVEINTGAESLLFSSKFGDYATAGDIGASDDALVEFKTAATGTAAGATVTLTGNLDVAAGKTVSMVTDDGYSFVLAGTTSGGGNLSLQSDQTAFLDGTLGGLDTITLVGGTPVSVTSAGALGLGNIVNVEADAFLHLAQAQANLADLADPPAIHLATFGALGGDLTGARYNGTGGPQNVFLSAGSVLAPTAGPEPLRGDLANGGATTDDLLYRGITDLAGTYTLGDNGVDSIYRGGIIAPTWTPAGNFTGTLQEAAGAAGYELGMRRDLTLENAIIRAAAGNAVAFTGDARLDLYANSLAADPGRADTFVRIGTAPTETDPGTTDDYVLWLNQPNSIPAGMTWTVENGIVRQTDDGMRQAIASGATLNIGPHATYFTSQDPHGSGQINILDGGTVRYGGTARLATMGWEDGATVWHNAGSDLLWVTGEGLPTDLALNVVVDETRTFGEGIYLGDGSRLGTVWNENANYQGGSIKAATDLALDGSEQVIISAGPGHNFQVNADVELTGVDIRTGDPDGTVSYLPKGDGDDLERVRQLGIRQTGEVEFNQRVRGDDLTMAGGNVIFNHADTNFSGDIDLVGGGVLYLGAGGNSDNQGNLTDRLISTTGLVEDRVADTIIIGDDGRAELGIQFDAATGPSGRVEVTQPFVIDGDVRPADKRSFWISRRGGTTALELDLMDITLNEGGVFAVDENNVNVRAYLKVAGNSTVTQFDRINYNDILRDASLPAYDGTNPVILNWGRLGDTGHDGDVRGTIGQGVQINIINGQIYFPDGPGQVLGGSIHTETAVDGGDSYVRFHAGQDGNVANRVTGTGEVVMGRSGVAGGTAEDIRGFVDEVTTGNPALLNVFAPTVRVVNDGDNNTDDASIESDRGVDLDVNGWLRYTDVRLEDGATTLLNQRNDSNLVVDFNLIAPSAKARNNDSDSRVYIGNVTGTQGRLLGGPQRRTGARQHLLDE